MKVITQCLILFVCHAALLIVLASRLVSQTLPREYIYANGRVAAVEVSYPPCGGNLQVLSVLPPRGSTVVGVGRPQNFEINYCNLQGGGAAGQATLLVNEELYAARGCYFVYNGIYDMYFLMNDAGNDWIVYAGSPISNSFCTISNPSRVVSGNYLTLKATITFWGPMAGSASVWSAITNNTYTASSGWQNMGSWNIAGNLPPSEITYSASGSRPGLTLALAGTDPNGFQNLFAAFVTLTNTATFSTANSCSLFYHQTADLFFLANDSYTSWMPVPPGGSVSNSQCTLSSLSAVSGSGNTLNVRFRLSFPTSGVRYVHALTQDRDDSLSAGGWQLLTPVLTVNP
jgi:hypothetical protein